MTPNTTATAGAVRAAEAVMQRYSVLDDSGAHERRNVAAIIDRETGAAELIAALEDLIGEFDENECGAGTSARIGKARAAIARARGTAE